MGQKEEAPAPAPVEPPPQVEPKPVKRDPKPISDVCWSVCIKSDKKGRYSGMQCQTMNSRGMPEWKTRDLNEWLNDSLLEYEWDSWIVYNDNSRGKGKDQSKAKGILAWNKDVIGWMIHSMPGWPESFPSNIEIYEGDSASHGLAHSFCWILIPRSNSNLYSGFIGPLPSAGVEEYPDKSVLEFEETPSKSALESILVHLKVLLGTSSDIIHQKQFFVPEEEYLLQEHKLVADSERMHVISLSNNGEPEDSQIYHVVRGRNWTPFVQIPEYGDEQKTAQYQDPNAIPQFYRHGMLPAFGPMLVRSGSAPLSKSRKSLKPTEDQFFEFDETIRRIDDILFHGRTQEKFNITTVDSDESKWAMSSEKNDEKWCFFGDADMLVASSNSPAGGVIIHDLHLRDNLADMVLSVNPPEEESQA